MTIAIRLAKRVVELASCSRREAELYIQGGWVQVDGVVVEQPQRMVSDEQITLAANASLLPVEAVTLMGNQIAATPLRFDAGTQSALDHSNKPILARHFERLLPVMPLERNASGLAIYTQDRKFFAQMTEQGPQLEQEFVVEVQGEIIPYGLARLRNGLSFKGRALPPMQASWQNEVRLRMALKNVQPGQLQAICADVGLQVVAIKRIRIGRIPLAKIAPGEWRYVDARERI
jgi:23S rRNA pseudouridine2604 synthase